jgi:ribonuclease P protein component
MKGALKRRRDFEEVYSNHHRYPGKCFVLLAHKTPGDQTRAGIVVGRKIGNAVKRNLVKRRARASIQLCPEFAGIGRDLLIIARPSAAAVDWAEFRNELFGHFRRILTHATRS